MKYKSFLLIFVAFLFIGIVFVFWKQGILVQDTQNNKDEISQSVETLKDVALDTLLNIQTKDWTLYSNPTLGYEITYPLDWIVDESGITSSLGREVIFNPVDAEPFTSYISVLIDPRPLELIQTVYRESTGPLFEERQMQFAGQKAYVYKSLPINESNFLNIYIPYNGLIYGISVGRDDSEEVWMTLSTFQFITMERNKKTVLSEFQELLPTKALSSSFSKTEMESWKIYDRPEWFFSLKYPSSLLQATCPADPSCYFGSLELDPQRYYSISDLPANAIFIDIGSTGAEDGSVIMDLFEWKKISDGLDPSAYYQLVTIGDVEALKEKKTNQETIYIPNGLGRVLEFTLFSVDPDQEKLFESMLSTLRLKESK